MTTAEQIPLHLDAEVIGPPLADDRSNLREWLAARRTALTGTDVAAIVGLSKWHSAAGVFLDKRGELPFDEAGDSEALEWGVRLEEPIARKFADSHPDLQILASPGVLRSKHWPFMAVNVDRLAISRDKVKPAPLEIKTTNQYLAGEWDPESDQFPAAALLQVHHEIAVTGADGAWLAVLIGGQRYADRWVPRDEEMVERLVEMEGRFWRDHVEAGVMPPMDGSKATTELLGRLYDVDPDAVTVLDPTEWLPLRSSYEGTKAALRAAEYAFDETCNRIRALLGPAQYGVCDGAEVVTWKQNGTFASSRFAAEHPALVEQFTRPLPALDTEALKRDHPDVYDSYRARVLRVPANPKKVRSGNHL